MKNNENVKERKSFKEVVVENKGKIIAGVSIVTAGALGVVLVKNHKDLFKFVTKVDVKSDLGIMANEELWRKVEVTEDIIVNSGVIDQAKAGIKGFDKMLDQCDELEYLYKARTLAENVLED